MTSIEFNLQAGIPTLDLRRYTEGSDEEKKAFATELGAAYRQLLPLVATELASN